jgi:hypothetical protein
MWYVLWHNLCVVSSFAAFVLHSVSMTVTLSYGRDNKQNMRLLMYSFWSTDTG